MFLIVTKFGGFYLCEEYVRNNGWYKLKQAVFIRRDKRVSTYASAEIKCRYVAIIESKTFRVDFDCPYKVYNRIVDYISNKCVGKQRFKKIKEVDV